MDFFNAHIDGNYDSSADYWKLTREGNLQYDGYATLRDADGKILRSYTQMGLSSIYDIEGALLWLLNIDQNDSAGVEMARKLMDWAGLNDIGLTYICEIYADDNCPTAGILVTDNTMGKPIMKETIATLYSFYNEFDNQTKEAINRIYGSPGGFLNFAKDEDDFSYLQSVLSRFFTSDEIENSQSTYGSNYVTYPDKDSLGFFNTLITPTLFNKYLPKTMTNSEGKPVTYTYCNQFVYDTILTHFGNEIHRSIFPGVLTNANTMFLSFINNQNMERLDINEWGTEGIKQLADDGYLIIASSYNPDGPGHIAFLGNRNLVTSSIPRTSDHMGKNGFDLPAHHYLFVQAGTFNGIISNQFATNDYENPIIRRKFLNDYLYFYRVRINP
jgi:hypothetical protein